MAKYDVESLLAEIESVLKANLNTKITAVDTEKGTISLKTVNASAYALQSMNDMVAAYDPFILYGVRDIRSEANGPYVNKVYDVDVMIIVSDCGQDDFIANRMFRYQRCLEEVFADNFTNNTHGLKIEIKSLVPAALTELNSSNSFRVIGVTLQAALA